MSFFMAYSTVEAVVAAAASCCCLKELERVEWRYLCMRSGVGASADIPRENKTTRISREDRMGEFNRKQARSMCEYIT